MRTRAADRVILAISAVVSTALLASCATGPTPESGSPPPAPAAQEPADAGAALVERRCTMCHTTERVYSKDYDAEQWDDTIERMKRNGLVISDEEKQQIIEYLVSRSQR